MKRALTDEQNAVADRVMAAIAGSAHNDAFAAFASIMAATINSQTGSQAEALAVGEMWGQLFVDMLVEGRKGAFAETGKSAAIDARFLI
jgi:hypothetical protein